MPNPPTGRPFPAFIADATQEPAPYGRWGESLAEEFARACGPFAKEAGVEVDVTDVRWFPERSWGGRVYVPASAKAETPKGATVEYYGHVSFVRPEDGNPEDIEADVDFTDVTAEDNPDWDIDLNDDVIGPWRAEAERGGDVTLIWGLPLVRGAVAATAEIGDVLVDQAPVVEGRFTLVAADNLRGFGEPLYLDIRLWDRELRELAAESLYVDDEPEPEPEPAEGSDP
jgi:hypothetical protein